MAEKATKKARLKCASCDREQEGFLQPDGSFVCPVCSPFSLYQTRAAEWDRAQKSIVEARKMQSRNQARDGQVAASAQASEGAFGTLAIMDEFRGFPWYWPILAAITMGIWVGCFWSQFFENNPEADAPAGTASRTPVIAKKTDVPLNKPPLVAPGTGTAAVPTPVAPQTTPQDDNAAYAQADQRARAAGENYSEAIAAYRQYLQRFPQGKFSANVKAMEAELAYKEAQRQAARQMEGRRFEAAQQMYRDYVNAYDNWPRATDARQQIERLQRLIDVEREAKAMVTGSQGGANPTLAPPAPNPLDEEQKKKLELARTRCKASLNFALDIVSAQATAAGQRRAQEWLNAAEAGVAETGLDANARQQFQAELKRAATAVQNSDFIKAREPLEKALQLLGP